MRKIEAYKLYRMLGSKVRAKKFGIPFTGTLKEVIKVTHRYGKTRLAKVGPFTVAAETVQEL